MLQKSRAFTITEMLVIFGIIGVVVAFTIPAVLNNASNIRFQTTLKKSLATLSQIPRYAMAKYEMDYAALTQNSEDSNCSDITIDGGSSTMCGMFNSALSGHSYLGVYGTVQNKDGTDPYTITTTTSGFNPDGYLLYSLSNGTIVGFKPDAKNCALGFGNILSSSIMTKTPTETDKSGLANCIGFIDVNGLNPPNAETTCSDGTSEYGVRPCIIKKRISDIYPIVLHDSIVEPATNAGRGAIANGRS